jgi:hypothetical protein
MSVQDSAFSQVGWVSFDRFVSFRSGLVWSGRVESGPGGWMVGWLVGWLVGWVVWVGWVGWVGCLVVLLSNRPGPT